MTRHGPTGPARPPAREQDQFPALAQWRRELAAGARTIYTFDALWRSACEEANAIEAATAGLPQLAEGYRRDAREIVRRALREVER